MARQAASVSSSTSKKRRRGNASVVLVSRTVLCSMCGISDVQLAVWEREDLVAPVRIGEVEGREERLYDREALRRVRMIRRLGEELEVNLPGIGVILHLLDQMGR
jgi:DNA-binding transcriptional MerR regulator